MAVKQAVVLAAGAGSRMREARPGAPLSAGQEQAADAGLKGLIPFERPFLDYLVEALRRSGIVRVCVVVGPRQTALTAYVEARAEGAVRLSTVVQEEPLGSGHALACARSFVDQEPFLVVNSDNFYPAASLRELGARPEWAVLAVERRATLTDATTNLTIDRLASFAAIEIDGDGWVTRLDEKPGRQRYDSLRDPVWSSVNAWRFDPTIFDHCDRLRVSPRGELELPHAALAAVRQGQALRPVPTRGVLDLSTRGDVAAVGRLLPAWFRAARHA